MIKKIANEDKIKLLIIFILNLILCNQFLEMHYSSDTYVLMDLGYMNYPKDYFLLDARLISAGVCYFAGLLKIPYNIYIIGMDFIGIVFLTVAIFAIYKTIYKYYSPKNNFEDLLVFCVSHVLILNQFTLELLLFPESGVMCLGMLCSVLAAIVASSDMKKKIVKLFVLITIMVFAYQPILNSCCILTILLIFMNQFSKNDNLKTNMKEFAIKGIKFAIIVFIVALANISLLKKTSENAGTRLVDLANMKYPEYLIVRTGNLKENLIDLIWNRNINMFPKYSNNIIIIITLLYMILNKSQKQDIMKYIIILSSIIGIAVIQEYTLNTGGAGRTSLSIGGVLGISLMYMLFASKNNKIKFEKIIPTIILSVFILNSIMIIRNISVHRQATVIEHNMGKTIKYSLEKYEKESGITVTKLAILIDQNPTRVFYGIRNMESMTERKISCRWSIYAAMNYFCDRKFEKVDVPAVIQKITVDEKYPVDFVQFTEDQLIFIGDTLCLVIY